MKVIEHRTIFKGVQGTATNTISFCSITRLSDGTLIASARIGSGKDTADGNVGLWRSSDLGHTWSGPEMPFKTDFNGIPGCLRAGFITQLPDGSLIITCAWVDRSVPGRGLYNPKTGGLCPMFPLISRSFDSGHTWSPLIAVDLFPLEEPCAITGPLLMLPHGALACQFETQKTFDDPQPIFNYSGFKISYDLGRTWPEYVLVAGRPCLPQVCWDQRIAAFPKGEMINLFWSYDTLQNCDCNIHVSYSSHHGRSWSVPADTGIIGQIACPVVLDEKRVVMLYVRRDEKRQILARLSFDGGRTWPADSEISVYTQQVDSSQSKDLFDAMNQWSFGHPVGIRLDNRTVAAVYYAGQSQHTSIEFCKISI